MPNPREAPNETTTVKLRLTTCGDAKTLSLLIVSRQGSSNSHCFANGIMADTAQSRRKKNNIDLRQVCP